jgi:hypothetical protein
VSQGWCSMCGCTEFHPCVLEDGTACAWADAEQTVCTACVPEMEHLGTLGGCDVYSPGTFGPGGWEPLRPDLRAIFDVPEPERPALILSFGPGSKDVGGGP